LTENGDKLQEVPMTLNLKSGMKNSNLFSGSQLQQGENYCDHLNCITQNSPHFILLVTSGLSKFQLRQKEGIARTCKLRIIRLPKSCWPYTWVVNNKVRWLPLIVVSSPKLLPRGDDLQTKIDMDSMKKVFDFSFNTKFLMYGIESCRISHTSQWRKTHNWSFVRYPHLRYFSLFAWFKGAPIFLM
jgi:hypothetical protein